MARAYTRAVKKLRRQGGCRFERQGPGDHEIRYSPISKHRFMVDTHIKSRHGATFTLRQAGVPKAF